MNLRRLYLYLVCTVAMSLLTVGLVIFGATVIQLYMDSANAPDSRTVLAYYSALILVAGPVWAVHFWFAHRFASRDPYDRASAIRRLYLYWACLVSSISAAVAIAIGAGDVLRPAIDGCSATGDACLVSYDWTAAAQAGWAAAVLIAVWVLHLWVAGRDRKAVDEAGASATLRRWYMYPALLVGLLMLLAGLMGALDAAWLKVVRSPLANSQHVGDGLGVAVAGLLLWGLHARTIARRHITQDRHSTLRALEGFIVLTVSIATALTAAGMILYYALARLLGVGNPGGVDGSDIAGALAAPASQLVVYGVAWALVNRRLARDAGTQEAARQAGIRRLYVNLVVLVSLAAAAAGAGGLLWTLAEQVEAPIIGVTASAWSDPVSKWLTLLVVGAAVWAAYWRHAPWAADRQSLSRRLYVWAALLGSVLGVLAGGIGMLNSLLQQLFSAAPKLNDPANFDVGHFLAVIVVAAAVGAYHWCVLQADAAGRPPKAATPPEAVTTATAPARVMRELSPPAAVPEVDPDGRRYTLVVHDATEDDIHQALAALPPKASYHLTQSSEPVTVDGR